MKCLENAIYLRIRFWNPARAFDRSRERDDSPVVTTRLLDRSPTKTTMVTTVKAPPPNKASMILPNVLRRERRPSFSLGMAAATPFIRQRRS
jgi:hypothetical protein